MSDEAIHGAKISSLHGNEEAEAEMGTVAQSNRALNFLIKLDGQTNTGLMSTLAITMIAIGLELQSAQSTIWADLDLG
jgi:hypothetical protein